MRLTTRTPALLAYRPKLAAPLPFSAAVWLGRLAIGEHVNVTLSADGPGRQTHVTVSGKVGRRSEGLADREFWTDVLNG